ncbi:hypothetical protein A1D30_05360 [Acidovorax sp. GW101-3H11]|nr:hypothetical protein A1D30_05360 [Acidovorax sp. GW101-3H11]
MIACFFKLWYRDDFNGELMPIHANFMEITCGHLIHQMCELRYAFAHYLHSQHSQRIQLSTHFHPAGF